MATGIFKTRGYFQQKLSKKMLYLAALPYIINLSFLKNAIKSEPLGVRGQCFQDFHIFMIPTTGKSFKKIHEVRVTCPGWFKMELPNSDFFLSANVAIITLKMYFIYFHINSFSGNIFLYQNLATYYFKL